jgi:hypothetical protein
MLKINVFQNIPLAPKRQLRYDLTMTELLERAFTEASKLPTKE